MAAAMSASYLRCSSSGYRYVGPLAVGFVGFAGGAPAGGEDVPAAPLTPGMDRMAGSSMSPSEPNEDRRTCPCVGGCATGTVVPGSGYTGCPCGVVSTVPRSGDPTGVAGASESVSNGPSPSDPSARESPSSPSLNRAPTSRRPPRGARTGRRRLLAALFRRHARQSVSERTFSGRVPLSLSAERAARVRA